MRFVSFVIQARLTHSRDNVNVYDKIPSSVIIAGQQATRGVDVAHGGLLGKGD